MTGTDQEAVRRCLAGETEAFSVPDSFADDNAKTVKTPGPDRK